jgi:hypothetical protein
VPQSDRLVCQGPEIAAHLRRIWPRPGALSQQDAGHVLSRVGIPGGAQPAVPAEPSDGPPNVLASGDHGHTEPSAAKGVSNAIESVSDVQRPMRSSIQILWPPAGNAGGDLGEVGGEAPGVRPEPQCKQIGKPERRRYVQPIVTLQPHADREHRREEQAIRLSPRDPSIGYSYILIGRVHLLQSRTDEAIVWLEKGCSATPTIPFHHSWLASAYALKDETERAAAELTEARKLDGGDLFASIAHLKAYPCAWLGAPKTRALFEATYWAGLRKAGMPEE